MGEALTPLCELAKKYGTDKFKPHNYTPVYWRHLHDRRETVKKVLEIGIARGARSLQMWEEFFPNASILGIDTDEKSLFTKGRIRSFICNQKDRAAMYQLGRHYGKWDLIVEDGDHNPNSQIAAMTVLLPFLVKGGLYFMEDIWADIASVARNVPPRFAYEIYDSDKVIPSGLRHKMMMIRHA